MKRIERKELNPKTNKTTTKGWIEYRDGVFVGSGQGAKTLRAILSGDDPACSVPVNLDMGLGLLQALVDHGEGYSSCWEFVDAPPSPGAGEVRVVKKGGKWVVDSKGAKDPGHPAQSSARTVKKKSSHGQPPSVAKVKLELSGWDNEPHHNPTLKFVLQMVEGVDANCLVPFLVLSRTSEDFVQTQGTDGDYRVEWSEQLPGKKRRHYVANKPGSDNRKRKAMIIAGKKQTPDESDVLSCAEAQAIFTAFYRGEPRPSSFRWQDITDKL